MAGLPASRVFEHGIWRDATDEDNTSGGRLHGDLPLARAVRVVVNGSEPRRALPARTRRPRRPRAKALAALLSEPVVLKVQESAKVFGR